MSRVKFKPQDGGEVIVWATRCVLEPKGGERGGN